MVAANTLKVIVALTRVLNLLKIVLKEKLEKFTRKYLWLIVLNHCGNNPFMPMLINTLSIAASRVRMVVVSLANVSIAIATST